MIKDGQEVTYIGNCDVIRTGNGFKWAEFGGDNIELVVGKKYPVISSCLMQSVFIKKDNEIIRDVSGERYLYWRIPNEINEQIYVWEGFFEENTNL